VATAVSRNWIRTTVGSNGPGASARTLALDSALHGYRSAFLVGAAIATIGGLVTLAAIRVARPPNAALQVAGEEAVNGDRARLPSSS
jgi:hypothetical protein